MFTTTAFILSNQGYRWCQLLYRTYVTEDPNHQFFVAVAAKQSIGTWGYELDGRCYAYPYDMVVDTKFNAAIVFSEWITFVGLIVTILVWFSICSGLRKIVWIAMGFLLLVNSLFEGMTLLLKKSMLCNPLYGTCSMDTGGRCAAAAVAFWFLAGVSVITVPAPAGPRPIQETETAPPRVENDSEMI